MKKQQDGRIPRQRAVDDHDNTGCIGRRGKSTSRGDLIIRLLLEDDLHMICPHATSFASTHICYV